MAFEWIFCGFRLQGMILEIHSGFLKSNAMFSSKHIERYLQQYLMLWQFPLVGVPGGCWFGVLLFMLLPLLLPLGPLLVTNIPLPPPPFPFVRLVATCTRLFPMCPPPIPTPTILFPILFPMLFPILFTIVLPLVFIGWVIIAFQI